MSKYLLEIGVEELPYKFIPMAISQLEAGFKTFLESNNEIIPLQTLIENGYLNGEYKDPLYGNEYDLNQSKVIVTKNNNSYEYEVELVIK